MATAMSRFSCASSNSILELTLRARRVFAFRSFTSARPASARVCFTCLGDRELEFPRIRRKLEQQVAFLHKLAGREVNLDQTSVHEGSDLDFDRSSHCALIFEHLGRSLLSPSQLDHQADCGA